MVHANENRGRHDDRLPPGDGEIDWARLLAQLNHLHFAGTLILEIADLGGPAAGTKIDGSHAAERRFTAGRNHQEIEIIMLDAENREQTANPG
jgi:sugar phosphate isomerase/epimerase